MIASPPKTLIEYVNPTKRQQEFIRAWRKHRFVLFGGAAGPGKSYILRWSLVLFLIGLYEKLKIERATVGLFCENYPSLHDRQISKIEREFPSWLGKLRRGETREFVLAPAYGGGVIALRNLDDPSKYLSTEFAGVGVDELTRNKLQVFNDLRLRLRWPGVERPIFLGATNPGGVGHEWVKKYWVEGKFPPEMQKLASEFDWVKALPTDNPHLTEQYWEDLSYLPEHMRRAYLEGDWNLLAGQYFGVFTEARHVIHESRVKIETWWPKWISGDWGFAHPSCIHWHARRDDGTVLTYRELYGVGIEEGDLGKRIASATPRSEKLATFFLSPDAFAKKGSANTVAQQIGDSVSEAGLPRPTQADNDRIGGARLMYQLLASDYWNISSACPKLIECLPSLIRDEDELEDVLKIDWAPGHIGDDPYDCSRYGLKSYLAPGKEPFESKLQRRLDSLITADGAPDYTRRHMEHLRMEEQHQQENAPVFLRKTRGTWRTRRMVQ